MLHPQFLQGFGPGCAVEDHQITAWCFGAHHRVHLNPLVVDAFDETAHPKRIDLFVSTDPLQGNHAQHWDGWHKPHSGASAPTYPQDQTGNLRLYGPDTVLTASGSPDLTQDRHQSLHITLVVVDPEADTEPVVPVIGYDIAGMERVVEFGGSITLEGEKIATGVFLGRYQGSR